jgi:hypothetical protein
MEMKVYVVMATCHGELEGILQVFATKEDAEKYIIENKHKEPSYMFIEEHEVS